LKANKAIPLPALLEKDDGGDALDPQMQGDVPVFVYIYLLDRNLTLEVLLQYLDDWSLSTARLAPRCIKIHQSYTMLYRILKII